MHCLACCMSHQCACKQVKLSPPCGIMTTTATPLSTLIMIYYSGVEDGMYGLNLHSWVWPKLPEAYVSIEVSTFMA